MKTTLKIGEREIIVNENGERKWTSLGLKQNEACVLPFIYLIQNVETHFVSMKEPNEEQQELLVMMSEYEYGNLDFDSDDEEEEFLEKYDEMKENGIGSKSVTDLGGISLKIEGDKYILEYEFDGTCPSERILTKEGNLLSEISTKRIFISLMNGETLCDFNIEDVSNGNLGINPNNEIEEFIKVCLNEEDLPSVGVLYNEYKDKNPSIDKAFKRLYSKAYIEKNNALKDVVTFVRNEDYSLQFLLNMSEEDMKKGMELFPDKQFVYSMKEVN